MGLIYQAGSKRFLCKLLIWAFAWKFGIMKILYIWKNFHILLLFVCKEQIKTSENVQNLH